MKKRLSFRKILLLIGILFFVFTLVRTFFAIQAISQNYLALQNADLTVSADYTLVYDDHIYAMIGFGINIDPSLPDMAESVTVFLENSMRSIDDVILACSILHTMLTNTIIAYSLYAKNKDNSFRHAVSVSTGVIVTFLVYVCFTALCHVLFHIPFYIPDGHGLTVILVSLLSVAAGECALGLLLRKIKFKKAVALAAVPVVFVMFLFGFNFEYHLFCLSSLDSFDYIRDIDSHAFDEDYEGDIHYDPDKNVMVLNGKEYEAQQMENPDSYQGLQRIGAYAYEILNPYEGNSLFFLEISKEEIILSVWILLLFCIKAFVWILVCGRRESAKQIQ